MDQPAPNPLLSVREVHKRYGGVLALEGVSFEIFPGEVHCLAGENGCGKSTLIKVISGVETADAGTVTLDGELLIKVTPRDAIRAGIQVIYQDFSLFPNLTVAENIVMTSLIASRTRLVNRRSVRRRALEVVLDLGVDLDVDARVEDLVIADRQLTAICRALAQDARVMFMDEPTTALTKREVDSLFTVVKRLQDRGVAVVFVSHKLDEVLEISQRVTVLRNGEVVASGNVREFDSDSLSRAMTGREIRSERVVAPYDTAAAPVIDVHGLGLKGAFQDVEFSVRPGEILGITGLLGSGRTEIAEALFGVSPATAGSIRVDGREVRIDSVGDAVAAGIGYVPPDRLTQGLFLQQSIADNVIASSLDLHQRRSGLLDRSRLKDTINTFFTALRIRAASVQAPIRSLSGGNQQRVVLAKWLARGPRVLILNSPTVGVDVGSKEEILEILRTQAAKGIGVIVISDDVPEVVAVCHRVLVVQRGAIHDVLDGDRVTERTILNGLSA